MTSHAEQDWSAGASLLGVAAWAVIATSAGTGRVPMGVIELLFLFGPLVVVPLGLELAGLVAPSPTSGLERWARWLQPFAAAMVVLSFWRHPGRGAAVLVAGWAVICGFGAMAGVLALLRKGNKTLVEILAHIGRLDLAVGGVWLMLSRSGWHIMGFREPIILLTAVHFHYSGFGMATIAAATLKTAQRRGWNTCLLPVVALLVTLLPFVIAIGFVMSPGLKVGAAVALSVSVGMLAVFVLSLSAELVSMTARLSLRGGVGFAVVGMALAAVYAVGDFLHQDWLVIPRMASTHGLVNGLGFVLLCLLGYIVELDVGEGRTRNNVGRAEHLVGSCRSLVRGVGANLSFVARDFYDR